MCAASTCYMHRKLVQGLLELAGNVRGAWEQEQEREQGQEREREQEQEQERRREEDSEGWEATNQRQLADEEQYETSLTSVHPEWGLLGLLTDEEKQVVARVRHERVVAEMKAQERVAAEEKARQRRRRKERRKDAGNNS